MQSAIKRFRTNRKAPWIRDLLAENRLHPSELILPLFIIEGENQRQKIDNLPGVERLSIDLAVEKIKEAQSLNIKAVMLFPVTPQNLKTQNGQEALNKNNLICKALKAIKAQNIDIGIICDVALDPYTTHGHDGLLDENGDVENDSTVEILCQQAVIQAQAGADIVAPSDMMDGRVAAIRSKLDEAGFKNVAIMSYAAKYASNFYGPFREAVGSIQNIKSADKKTYQMDSRNSQEAIAEILQDQKEGADMIIVKPAMPYLDIVKEASQKTNLPIIPYQVSGEYAMLKIAAEKGVLNYEEAMLESLIAFKRAGARAIITYGAIEVAKML